MTIVPPIRVRVRVTSRVRVRVRVWVRVEVGVSDQWQSTEAYTNQNIQIWYSSDTRLLFRLTNISHFDSQSPPISTYHHLLFGLTITSYFDLPSPPIWNCSNGESFGMTTAW